MTNTLPLDMLSNKIEKTAILFELYLGLETYFAENPKQTVEILISFKNGAPKSPKYIHFENLNVDNNTVCFSNVFNYLHKCIVLFEPYKSPFGLFSNYLMDNPQEIKFIFNKENFLFIFNYADSFEGKSEWLNHLDKKHIFFDKNEVWGEYPTIINNSSSYQLWEDLKKKDSYIKNTYNFKIFSKNMKLIKENYSVLTKKQSMVLEKSFLTIFEGGKIIESIELDNFKFIRFSFDKQNNSASFKFFIENNANILGLNYGLTEEIVNQFIE